MSLPSLVKLCEHTGVDPHITPVVLDTRLAVRHDVCQDCDRRTAFARIGTDSQFAEVYYVEDGISSYVLKVMPLMYTQTMQQCESEYHTALYLSRLRPDRFVSVYNNKVCSVYLKPESRFYKPAMVFHLFESGALNTIDGATKKIAEKIKATRNSLSFDDPDIERILRTTGLLQAPINAYVFRMEVMRGDLGQIVLRQPINWSDMKTQVIQAVLFMVSQAIVHNDLHIHNIVVNEIEPGRLNFKVHDFGKAEAITAENRAYASRRDLSVFCASLEQFHQTHGSLIFEANGCLQTIAELKAIVAP